MHQLVIKEGSVLLRHVVTMKYIPMNLKSLKLDLQDEIHTLLIFCSDERILIACYLTFKSLPHLESCMYS